MLKKSENLLNQKNVKIIKQAHAFKGYANSINAETSNFFNFELQLKDTESAIKNRLKKAVDWIKRIGIRESLFYKSNTCWQKNTTCIVLWAKNLLSKYIIKICFNFGRGFYGSFLMLFPKAPASCCKKKLN